MARPSQMPKRQPLSDEDIERASYVGSKEHKVTRWFEENLPGAWIGPDGVARRTGKQHTSICRLVGPADQLRATGWVRDALRDGRMRYYDGDDRYPKRIWYKDESGQFWSGFLVNSGQGSYKGWPTEESEKIEIFG